MSRDTHVCVPHWPLRTLCPRAISTLAKDEAFVFCLKDIATVLALLGEHFPSLTRNPLIFLCISLGCYNVALEIAMLSFFSYLKSRALHTQERLDAGKQR